MMRMRGRPTHLGDDELGMSSFGSCCECLGDWTHVHVFNYSFPSKCIFLLHPLCLLPRLQIFVAL
jgi:hypothetical protein